MNKTIIAFLNLKLILILLIGVTLLASCNKEVIRGSGPIGQKNFSINGFNAVETHYDIKAIVSYGSSTSVVASGYENLLNILDFRLENGVLKLKYNDTYNTIRRGNIVVNITMPNIERITTNGSGDCEIRNMRSFSNLELGIYGSGNIALSNSVYPSAKFGIYGSGHIYANGLDVNQAEVNIHGSGNVTVLVRERLKASIFGSGNIYYFGNPQIEFSRNGSGRLVKR